jgi:hypothetical protein
MIRKQLLLAIILVTIISNVKLLSQNIDINIVNKQWLNYFHDTNDKYIFYKGFTLDPIKFSMDISSYNYYRKLTEYLNSLDFEIEIIRVINVQDFGIIERDNYLDYYKPQAYFIYQRKGEKAINLVYTKADCSIVDTIIKPKFNFNYLQNKMNYKYFGDKLKQPLSYAGPLEGKGISISVASGKEIFSVFANDFWQYRDGKIEEFSEISGNKKTIEEVRNLVKQLYEIGVIKDEVFETECK